MVQEATKRNQQARELDLGEEAILTILLLKTGDQLYEKLEDLFKYETPELTLLRGPTGFQNMKKRQDEIIAARLREVKKRAALIADVALKLRDIVDKRLEKSKGNERRELLQLKKNLDKLIEEMSRVIIPLNNEFLARRFLGSSPAEWIENSLEILKKSESTFRRIVRGFKPLLKDYLLRNKGELTQRTLRKWGITSPGNVDVVASKYFELYGKDEEVELIYGKSTAQHAFSIASQFLAPEVLLTAIDQVWGGEKPGAARWAFALALAPFELTGVGKLGKEALEAVAKDAKLGENAFRKVGRLFFTERKLENIMREVSEFWERNIDDLAHTLAEVAGQEANLSKKIKSYIHIGIKNIDEAVHLLKNNTEAQRMFAMIYLDFKGIGLSEDAAALLAANICLYEIRGGLGHSTRLALLSYLVIGEKLSVEEMRKARILAYIHDWGKGATIPKEGNMAINIVGEEATHHIDGKITRLTPFGEAVIQKGHIISSYYLLTRLDELIGANEAKKLLEFIGSGNQKVGFAQAEEIILKHHPTSLGNHIERVDDRMLFFSLLDISDAVASIRLYGDMPVEKAATIIIQNGIKYFGSRGLAEEAIASAFLALASYSGMAVRRERVLELISGIIQKTRGKNVSLTFNEVLELVKKEPELLEIVKNYRDTMLSENGTLIRWLKTSSQ